MKFFPGGIELVKKLQKGNVEVFDQKFIEDTLYKYSPSSSETEDGIEYNSVMEHVQQVIDKLPERQKTIFLKSRQEYKSTKEISEEVGLSPGTIDNYISESLKLIRNLLHNEILQILLFFSLFFF